MICTIPLIVPGSVIISTGLMVLVDDCIKRRWHSRRRIQLAIPVKAATKQMGNYVGPKRLVDEIFNRHGDTRIRRKSPQRHF